jgi:hypothetical protein
MGGPASGVSMQAAQMQAMGGVDYKAFDAGKMKAGRLGHYGYLEGRGEYIHPTL